MEDVLSPRQPAKHDRPAKSAAARSSATVLLIDDRSYDCDPIAEALQAHRIAAPALPSARRAVAFLERAVERIDAVLLSTSMPGCLDFVRIAASLRPDLRFLLLGLHATRTPLALEHLDRIGRPCRVVFPQASEDVDQIVREIEGLIGERGGREAA